MDDHLHHEYNDKMRKFMHRALRNIDYFSTISNKVLNEICYKFQVMNIEKDKYLYKAGQT